MKLEDLKVISPNEDGGECQRSSSFRERFPFWLTYTPTTEERGERREGGSEGGGRDRGMDEGIGMEGGREGGEGEVNVRERVCV